MPPPSDTLFHAVIPVVVLTVGGGAGGAGAAAAGRGGRGACSSGFCACRGTSRAAAGGCAGRALLHAGRHSKGLGWCRADSCRLLAGMQHADVVGNIRARLHPTSIHFLTRSAVQAAGGWAAWAAAGGRSASAFPLPEAPPPAAAAQRDMLRRQAPSRKLNAADAAAYCLVSIPLYPAEVMVVPPAVQADCSYAAAWLGLEPAAGRASGGGGAAAGSGAGAAPRPPQEDLVLHTAGVSGMRPVHQSGFGVWTGVLYHAVNASCGA